MNYHLNNCGKCQPSMVLPFSYVSLYNSEKEAQRITLKQTVKNSDTREKNKLENFPESGHIS